MMQKQTQALYLAAAGLVALSGCTVHASTRGRSSTTPPPAAPGAGTTSGVVATTPPPGSPPPAAAASPGGSVASAPTPPVVAASADCPDPGNHCLAADILFAGNVAFEQGTPHVDAARLTQQPNSAGEATFMRLRDGASVTTRHYFKTHAAKPDELQVGRLAIVLQRRNGPAYRAPRTQQEATSTRWWMGRIVSLSAVPQGSVLLNSGRVAELGAIRLVDGDQSPSVAVSNQDDTHFVSPTHVFVTANAVPDTGRHRVNLAVTVKEASAQTQNEGQYLQTHNGKLLWTRHAFRTRQATATELKPGMTVVGFHRRTGPVYRKPNSREEALGSHWWISKVVDTSMSHRGEVQLANGDRASVDALRVILP